MAPYLNISKMAMIGAGSMGGGMALLFAENGLTVSIKDPSEEAMDKVVAKAKEAGISDKIRRFKDYEQLCSSLDTPKLITFSLPHGRAGDTVLQDLMPFLEKGDIILDAANENYENTQRRQGITCTKGIRYIAVGVSGGYQAARRGPSMCPSGDDESLDLVLPLLEKVAARDAQGVPCVARCGLGGSGHYVKTIHNGIEHGMMSALCEAWQIMRDGLAMSYNEIGDTFAKWNEKGELRNTFLVKIAADICRAEFPSFDEDREVGPKKVVSTVLDKVVQDLTGEEGTGVWSSMEAVRLHVPAPTLTAAHYLRVASAYRGQREKIKKRLFDASSSTLPMRPTLLIKRVTSDGEIAFLLESLRVAVYTAFLASYVQGMSIIDTASRENKWCVDYAAVRQIWRAGCIIQSEHISDAVLNPAVESWSSRGGKPLHEGQGDTLNLLLEPIEVTKALMYGYDHLKVVLARCVEGDFVVPALSATAEWIKYIGNTDLPTSFQEAQLDYFGAHMYDTKDEAGDVPGPTTGKHHFEWKPA